MLRLISLAPDFVLNGSTNKPKRCDEPRQIGHPRFCGLSHSQVHSARNRRRELQSNEHGFWHVLGARAWISHLGSSAGSCFEEGNESPVAIRFPSVRFDGACLGAASSSCSCAAVASLGPLFRKVANFTAAVGEFELAIMIELWTEDLHGSD